MYKPTLKHAKQKVCLAWHNKTLFEVTYITQLFLLTTWFTLFLVYITLCRKQGPEMLQAWEYDLPGCRRGECVYTNAGQAWRQTWPRAGQGCNSHPTSLTRSHFHSPGSASMMPTRSAQTNVYPSQSGRSTPPHCGNRDDHSDCDWWRLRGLSGDDGWCMGHHGNVCILQTVPAKPSGWRLGRWEYWDPPSGWVMKNGRSMSP